MEDVPQLRINNGAERSPKSYIDSGRSWVITGACAWNFFWLTLVNRSSGVMFVCIKDQFGLSRQEASWGFSLMDTLSSFTAIACSILYRYFDTRAISAMGVALVALGFILSTFIYTATVVTVIFGFIVGIGQGLMYFSNAITINQYFVRYRATANGLYFAAGTLGSFFVPPILFQVVEYYGLRSTFLLLGGLALNGLAASILLKSPQPNSISPHQVTSQNDSEPCCSEKEPLLKDTDLFTDDQDWNHYAGEQSFRKSGVLMWLRTQFRTFGFVFKPIFIMIVFSGVAFTFSFVIYPVTMVDYALGRGFDRSHASLLLVTYSLGDLTGRLFVGAFSDIKIIERDTMMALIYLIWSLSFLALPMVQTYSMIVTVSILLGFGIGSGTPMYNVLLADHLGISMLPLTFGVYRFILGFASLTRPHTIGYFRDIENSYDGLYYLLGAYAMAISVMWAIGAIRTRRNQAQLKQQFSSNN